MFRKKHKHFKAISAILDHSKTRIFSENLKRPPPPPAPRPIILVLLRPCIFKQKDNHRYNLRQIDEF